MPALFHTSSTVSPVSSSSRSAAMVPSVVPGWVSSSDARVSSSELMHRAMAAANA